MKFKGSLGNVLETYSNKLEKSKSKRNAYISRGICPTKLNQEDINHLNRSITSNEIEAIIVPQQRKAQTILQSNNYKNSMVLAQKQT
jgi:hypothetical protein